MYKYTHICNAILPHTHHIHTYSSFLCCYCLNHSNADHTININIFTRVYQKIRTRCTIVYVLHYVYTLHTLASLPYLSANSDQNVIKRR